MKLGFSFVLLGAILVHGSVFSAHHAFQRSALVDTATIDGWMADSKTAPLSVEDFLGRLPLVYRSHFTLMYQSSSLHRATPPFPRIIFFGPDARLLTAVSTDPGDPRRNTVEMIQFEPKQAKFSFHEISFDGGAPRVNHSPSKCQKCHGSDSRPNWEPYDAWPGAYGSVHDKMAYGTHENELFSKFLAKYKQEPRFLSLPEQFVLKQETFGEDATYYTVSRGAGSNSLLSLLLSFANRERIVRTITQSSNHALYRNAIVSALLGCPDSPEATVPPSLKDNHPRSYTSLLAETRSKIEKDHERRVERTAKLQKISDLEEFKDKVDRYGLREEEIVRIAKLRYLLENRITNAVKMNDWSLALHRDSYNFNDGASGLGNLIGHYIPAAFSGEEALRGKIQYKTTPFDATSYSDHGGHGGGPDAFKLEFFEAIKPSSDLCQELKRTSTPDPH